MRWPCYAARSVPGLLRGPVAGRMGGDAEEVDPAGEYLHHDQDIDPAQSDGVEVEEVGGQQPVGLGTQELPPTGVHTAGRRPGSGAGEDPADGASADPVAEAEQFAL